MTLRVKSSISPISRMLYRSVQLLSGIQKEKEKPDYTPSHEDECSNKMSKFNTQSLYDNLENKGLGKEQAKTISESSKVLRKIRNHQKHCVVTKKDLALAVSKYRREFKKLELQRIQIEANLKKEAFYDNLPFFRDAAIAIGGLLLAILSLLK